MDSSVQTIPFWGVMAKLTRVKNKPILYEIDERASFPIPGTMVTSVYLATVRVKVTITVSIFPWFSKENSLLSLFSVCVCVWRVYAPVIQQVIKPLANFS